LAAEGFRLERHSDGQRISHTDNKIFEAYGFLNEESPVSQLNMLDKSTG
jgi:hypothetical protein